MRFSMHVRGLGGSALIWGIVGAGVGTALFLARFQPWQRSMDWSPLLQRFAGFAGSGALWGSVCGLAFGAVIWAVGRRNGASTLSAAKLTLWGAIGGAAFPLILYTPVVLSRGVYGLIPFYGMLTGVSALAGALCGRAIFSLAQRAPESPAAPPLLGASVPAPDLGMRTDRREPVR